MSNIITKENALIGEKYYYTKHKSGLDIYLVPKKLSTSYAVIGTRYGSVDNRFKKKSDAEFTVVPDGIAHFLEHKMFENEDGVDTFERFAALGAQANAYTSFDMTAYLFSCTQKFAESLEVLLDYVTHPYFTEQTVEKEQGIIAQEIRMGEDNPGRALLFGMLKSLYHKHNVRIEIAGTVESISKITAPLLYSSYNTFYNLNNMALCVSGDVEMNTILDVADRILKPAEPFEIESVAEPEPENVASPRFSRQMQVSKPIFAIGVKNTFISADPDERMRESAAISVMTDILFGKSSEFYNKLYEDGLITGDLDIWDEHNRSYSFVCLSGESNDPEAVYKRFLDYVEEIKTKGMDEEEFTRCKRIMYSSFVRSFDSTDEIANNFLSYVFDGGDMLDYSDVVASLDINYANELFARIFKEGHFNLTTVMPLDAE